MEWKSLIELHFCLVVVELLSVGSHQIETNVALQAYYQMNVSLIGAGDIDFILQGESLVC